MKKLIFLLIVGLIILWLTPPASHADTFPAFEFSEVSFKNSTQDFIKIKINRPNTEVIQIIEDKLLFEVTPEQITTQTEIEILFKAETDEIKTTPEKIQINTTKKGLTATTEQLTLKEFDTIINIVCWQNSDIAAAEQKDLDEFLVILPELQCLNSEEVKKEGTIHFSQSGWQIINPVPKPKKTKSKSNQSKSLSSKSPKVSSANTYSSKSTATSNSKSKLASIQDLEIATENDPAPPQEKSYLSEILIAGITILLSFIIIMITGKSPKDPP